MSTTPNAAPNSQQARQQQNANARALIKALATVNRQIIYSSTITNPASQTLNIPMKPVGLLLGLYVEIDAVVTNTSSGAITPTDFGASNILEGINFVDLNNYTRIQTTGQHMHMLNTVRNKFPHMSCSYSTGNIAGSQATIGWDDPEALGPNWNLYNTAPSISATNGTGKVKIVYYIPLSYSTQDLRGSIYAGVINATMQLGMTFCGTTKAVSVASGDSTFAMYTGGATASITSATVTVTQHYYDQLPIGQGGIPILPVIDTNTVYDIKSTYLTGLGNGQDFALPYTNYRDFLSVLAVYNDGSSTNGGRPKLSASQASNLNYVAVQTANLYYPVKNTPYLQAGLYRNITGTDLPPGTYYFPSREKPVSTTQQGNQQVVLNPANLGSTQTPYVQMYTEAFGIVSALTQAGSLASS